MRKIDIFLLVMWIFVGVCNVIVCASGQEPRWRPIGFATQ